MEPFPAPFDPHAPVRSVHRTDMEKFRIPVFIEKADKELLHGHLGGAVHVQVRQDSGNIV